MSSDRAKFKHYRLENGCVVNLDADSICNCLFELTKERGHADKFLARELTNGLIYFLAIEFGHEIPIVSELAESAEKYVRELGHPGLSAPLSKWLLANPMAFAACSLPDSSGDPEVSAIPDPLPSPNETHQLFDDWELERFSLERIFPRDVVSMHRDELLHLGGLSRPFELAGSAVRVSCDFHPNSGIADQVEAARFHTGQYIAIDRAESGYGIDSDRSNESIGSFFQTMLNSARRARLGLLVNLNQQRPLAIAEEALFSQYETEPGPPRVNDLALSSLLALSDLAKNSDTPVEILWHLSGTDLQPENSSRIISVIRLALANARLKFVCDRARYEGDLGAGLRRENPATLLGVGIQLFRLAEQTPARSLDQFLSRLGILARLSGDAGGAKLDFLRSHARPESKQQFRLDRARLVVTPIGLEAAVRHLTNCPISDEGHGANAANAILRHLRHSLENEMPRNLEACLDSLPPIANAHQPEAPSQRVVIDGATPWDADSIPRLQVKAAGALHAIAGAGTAEIRISAAADIAPEELLGLLRIAWHQSEVHRIRFHVERE